MQSHGRFFSGTRLIADSYSLMVDRGSFQAPRHVRVPGRSVNAWWDDEDDDIVDDHFARVHERYPV